MVKEFDKKVKVYCHTDFVRSRVYFKEGYVYYMYGITTDGWGEESYSMINHFGQSHSVNVKNFNFNFIRLNDLRKRKLQKLESV